MARIRTIKPEFWADEKMSMLEPIARLVFLGVISMADDAGRLVDSIKQIDAFLFPGTRHTSRQSLSTLTRLGRIERGVTASGQCVIQITNWKKHQRVDHPNMLAALPEISGTIREKKQESSGNRDGCPPEALATLSVPVPTTSTNDLRSTTNDRNRQGSGVVGEIASGGYVLQPPTAEDFAAREAFRVRLEADRVAADARPAEEPA